MATVKLDQRKLRSVRSSIRKEITRSLRQKEIRQEIGALVAQDIKDNPVGQPASSTLAWRKRYDSYNATDKKYQRNQINFTFTGELLKDLATNVRLDKGMTYVIENSDKLHKKYKKKKGTIGNKRAKFSDIAQGQRDHGYTYPNLTDKTLAKIVDNLRKKIFNRLKTVFKVSS